MMSAEDVHRRRIRLLLTTGWLVFWGQMIAVAVLEYLRSGRTRYWEPLLWDGSSGLVATLMLWLMIRKADPARQLLDTPWRWFLYQFRWIPVVLAGGIVGIYSIRHTIYWLAGVHYSHEPWGEVIVYESLKGAMFAILFIAIWFGFLSYEAMREQARIAERNQSLARQSQLQLLTAQMQPHFLFNALNTISAEMQVDTRRADSLLAQLAEVLRGSLAASEQLETTLADELRLLRAYASLMAERFADRVALDWDIDESLGACKLPVLCLQPLLENVFKHTVEKRSAMTHIRIAARRQSDGMLLTVQDDAGRLHTPRAGAIGLANLRERIQTLYGAGATLTLTQIEPAGVRAALLLPCAS